MSSWGTACRPNTDVPDGWAKLRLYVHTLHAPENTLLPREQEEAIRISGGRFATKSRAPVISSFQEPAMRILKAWWLLGCAFFLVGAAYAYQAPFREYPSIEHGESSPAAGLEGENRICFCAADVSAGLEQRLSRPLDGTGVKGCLFGRRIIRRRIARSRRRSGA